MQFGVFDEKHSWTNNEHEVSEYMNVMSEMFKELLTCEQKFVVTSIEDRRQFNKKSDIGEEMREVMGEVKNMEGAMHKCCEIAKFAIEKYEDLVNKHQQMLIDYDDVQHCQAIQEEKDNLNQDALKRAQKHVIKLQDDNKHLNERI